MLPGNVYLTSDEINPFFSLLCTEFSLIQSHAVGLPSFPVCSVSPHNPQSIPTVPPKQVCPVMSLPRGSLSLH